MKYILWIQVMVQPHNRHMSMSWYLAVIAVADNIVLSVGTFNVYDLFGIKASNVNRCRKYSDHVYEPVRHELNNFAVTNLKIPRFLHKMWKMKFLFCPTKLVTSFLFSMHKITVMILALVTHLATQAGVRFPPNQFWFCRFVVPCIFSGFLCSTLLVVSMTFGRFYSILMPLKAASFNTVKRARFTIICIYVFGFAFNIPQAFLVGSETYQCNPYGKAGYVPYGMVYYWFSFVINYVLPFLLLLSMNSVIIHKIRQRNSENISDDKDQNKIRKYSEGQTFAILLLVTFTLLILTTPAYMFFIYIQVVDFISSPEAFASYFLFYHSSYALQVTNYGINFFLYVISGKKFRTDLMGLFRMKNRRHDHAPAKETETSSMKNTIVK